MFEIAKPPELNCKTTKQSYQLNSISEAFDMQF